MPTSTCESDRTVAPNGHLQDVAAGVSLGALDSALSDALARLGHDAQARQAVLQMLRDTEARCADQASFQDNVRWPLICALLRDVAAHPVHLEQQLVYEATLESRIERALLLSAEEHPDHVWEPQTTRLLTALARRSEHVIVGGAYAGDQVMFIAQALSEKPNARVHAFEPMRSALARLLRHIEINALHNVLAHELALWDESGIALQVCGAPALASSRPAEPCSLPAETVSSIRIDDYVDKYALPSIGLIMLDTEGGEEKALRGAARLLALPSPRAPQLVFEIHREFVDWTAGLAATNIVRLVSDAGYSVFAIRDYHGNHRMTGWPIEVIPAARVYLDGPPHGFNLLATKEASLLQALDLRIVAGVSPKLLAGRDSRLHAPLHGPSS